MPLALLVAVTVLVVIALMGAAGYVIERSATRHEPVDRGDVDRSE
jgi:hypothetical protein